LSQSLAHGGNEDKKMAEKRYELMVKEDNRKEMKATMFQYEKVGSFHDIRLTSRILF